MTEKPKSISVFLVDDDVTFRQVMASELTRRGYAVVSAGSGSEALDKASKSKVDVTLLDLRLPDMDGIDVLAQLREQNPAAGVVVLTGHGTIDTAIQAIRLGAYDYLEKPCPIEKLEMAIQKTCEHVRLVKRQKVLEDGFSVPNVVEGLVGASPAFAKLLDDVANIARTDSTTLILGETGVGKEVVASLLHAQSPRAEAPFVVVDCAALHEDLLQSEIFGHEKGAFTGAVRQKHGLFEVANGGTIFLDEVGDTSPEIQAKLLRILETSRFRRLGGTDEIEVDVRIVAATNRDLRRAISRGHFRKDLFYRLASITVRIPPLRERREDISVLVDHFTDEFNRKFSLSKMMSGEAMNVLLEHAWPGNVRELIHVVEQTVVLSKEAVIQVEDLPSSVQQSTRPVASVTREQYPPLREVERRHILTVLKSVGGNRGQAAHILGISERNIYRRLKKYQPASDADRLADSPPERETDA
jgi:two-component system NtrC family response regulator/two-component system response regulator AtoC